MTSPPPDTIRAAETANAARAPRLGRWIAAAVIVLLAFALRLSPSLQRSLWTDEFTTLEVIGHSWGDIGAERLSRGHYPTYFWLLKGWSHLFGTSHLALRTPSLLANLLALAALVVLVRIGLSSRLVRNHLETLAAPGLDEESPDVARRHTGRPLSPPPVFIATASAAILFAFHQRSVWSAVEARPYALTMALVVVSQAALLRLLTHGPHVGASLTYLVATLGAALTHATALPALAAQPVAVLLALRWVRGVDRPGAWTAIGAWGVAAGAGATGALFLALVSSAGGDGARAAAEAAGDGGPGFGFAYDAFAQLFVGEYKYLGGSSLRHLGVLLAVTVAILAGWHAWRRGGQGERLLALLAASWLAGPLALLPALMALGKMGEYFRYFTPAVPGAVLLAALAAAPALRRARNALEERGAHGLLHPREFWAAPPLLYGLFVIAVAGAFAIAPGERVSDAVRRLAEKARADEAVIVCTSARHGETLIDYYGPVDAPTYFIDREETDPALVLIRLLEATSQHSGFWLLLYKAEDSPILDCARILAPGYERTEKWTHDAVELHRFSPEGAPRTPGDGTSGVY